MPSQYLRFGNSLAATSIGKMPSFVAMYFGNGFLATISLTTSINCGPSCGLHSIVTFSLPAIMASKAPLTPSMEIMMMSLPGFLPAASIAWIAPIAISSLCANRTWILSSAFRKADDKIQVLFAHNDDMAIGAIQAIEAAGKKPGKDIIIISMDGVKGAFEAMMAGKLNVTIECNPQLGPQLMDVVKDIVAKKPLPKYIATKEGVFPME